MNDCVVIVFADQVREDTKGLMKLMHAEHRASQNTKISETIQKLKKRNILVATSSKFFSKDNPANLLPPNEEEDLGLELIAYYLFTGTPSEE